MNKGVICMVFVSVIGAAAAQGLFEQMAMLSMFSGLGGMGSSSSSTPAGGYQSLQSGYQPKSPGYPTGRSGRQGQQGEQRSQGYNAQSRGNSGLAAAQYPFGLLALSQAGGKKSILTLF